MKKTISSLALLCLAIPAAVAQKTIDTISWTDRPVLHAVAPEFAKASSVIITNKVKIEYKDELNRMFLYKTSYRLVKVQDEKGIESFNKMTIPTYEGMSLEFIRARTILPSGKVLEVTKDKMKEQKAEDGSTQLSFAMEGVEKNAEIELEYCYKRPYTLFGTETIQFGVPVMNTILEISSPSRIVYEEKGYNGFPTVKDTVIGERRYIKAEKVNIAALPDENYSFYDLNRMRAEYKASYSSEDQPKVRKFTWNDLARQLYESNYIYTEREKKATDKYLARIGLQSKDDDLAKVQKIENAIKTEITLYKSLDDADADRIDHILQKKAATESGMVRLFAACLSQAGIKAELGITTDRTTRLFDPEFENWGALETYLFYLPDLKVFLHPSGLYYRCPVVPSSTITNKGMFCKLTTLGDATSALPDIRTITPMPVGESEHSISANITFNADMEPTTDITYSFAGYSAVGIREAVLLVPKDKTKELIANIISIAEKPESIVSYSTEDEGFEHYYDKKPLKVTAKVNTPQLVEKAGAKYLLKIGDVIGKQDEMYQNNERKLPLDVHYPHMLNRTITVQLPDGYKILNPEVLVLNAACKDAGGKENTAFHSSYKIDGNKLTVTISEFYEQLHFPQSDYETFRTVINASADFNKVKLLLGKS